MAVWDSGSSDRLRCTWAAPALTWFRYWASAPLSCVTTALPSAVCISSICRRAESTAPSYTSRSRASSRSARAVTRTAAPTATANTPSKAIREMVSFFFSMFNSMLMIFGHEGGIRD